MLENKFKSNTKITIGMPGMLTTIQDMGNIGFQQYGMPVAGVIDQENYVIGQALIGETGTKEKPYLGALECTMLPPILTCEGSCVVAFTGANMAPNINGEPVPMYRPITCKDGDVISGTYAQNGMRMYIFFAGGIGAPKISSVSNNIKTKTSGIDGRKLQLNDVISVVDSTYLQKGSNVSDDFLKSSQEWNFKEPIRIVLDPKESSFTKEEIESFESTVYTLTISSKARGYCLKEKASLNTKKNNNKKVGAEFTSIKVPTNGKPICLMEDCKKTGCSKKIGAILSVDLPRLAQLPTGSNIKFSVVSLEESQELFKKYSASLNDKLKIAEKMGSRIVNKRVKH